MMTPFERVVGDSSKDHTVTAPTFTTRPTTEQLHHYAGRHSRATRFVKTSGSARSLDEAALARARAVAGLKGYVTNIPEAIMPAGEVISSYHDLWHVEASFRMSKTDLRARPFFARTREAIEAHLTIVFAALAVSRTIQDRTGLSIRKVLRDLRPLRSATIEAGGVVTDVAPAIPADKQALLDALRTPSSGH